MFKSLKNRKLKVKSQKLLLLIFFLFSILYSIPSTAQCAMCRASLESEGNIQKAEAVNNGIVYLMVIPYVLAGTLGYVIYKMYKNRTRD